MAVTVLIEDIVTHESWAYPCDQSPIIIGRAPTATISIARSFISGLHATIRHDEQQIAFVDMDSLNGTLLDGQPIPNARPVTILPESELLLGKRLRLSVRRGIAELPDPARKSPFDAQNRPAGAAIPRVATNVLSDEELDELARARKAREATNMVAAAREPLQDRPSREPALEPGLLPPKTRLGRYYILRLVARGGMGAVYRAEDPETEQAVAIKTLAPELASKPEARARFLREAKVACRVTHRNIIKIFGYDIHDGIPYLIMEYLRGEGLHTLLDRGPLAIDRAAGIGAAVCAGMSAVHEHGIIHRDLKPSNIFLADTDEGQLVKVLDFGVSKAQASQDPFRTGMNAIIGSLPYMSPEQATGGVELDARSDQFSLGVILYECLTGRRPHRGETPYTLSENIIHGRFEPPVGIRPEIPGALNDVIIKSMSAAPRGRYDSLRELGVALLPFSSAQAQRQLTDLLSGAPQRMSRVQVSAPIPADWYESVRSPTPPRKLPRTETAVAETGQALARSAPVQALAGGTQIMVGADAPAALELSRRESAPRPGAGALVPFAPVGQAIPERDASPQKHTRPISLWQAAVFVAVGFAMGALGLWLISPRARNADAQPAPLALAPVAVPPSWIAPPPVVAPRATVPAPVTERSPKPLPAPEAPAARSSERTTADLAGLYPPHDQPSHVARREAKRSKRRGKAPPSDIPEEPARTKNGVRILE